jgi:hypothetical protein
MTAAARQPSGISPAAEISRLIVLLRVGTGKVEPNSPRSVAMLRALRGFLYDPFQSWRNLRFKVEGRGGFRWTISS